MIDAVVIDAMVIDTVGIDIVVLFGWWKNCWVGNRRSAVLEAVV